MRKAISFYEEGAMWEIFSLPAHLLLPVCSLRQYLLNTLYVPDNLPKHWEHSSEQTKNFWSSQSLYSNILLKWIMTLFPACFDLIQLIFMTFCCPSDWHHSLAQLQGQGSTLQKRYMEGCVYAWVWKVMPGLGAQVSFSSAGVHVLSCSSVM